MKNVVDRSLEPSIFGRQQFLFRRLHSLLGLIPIGAFLVIHLATNATILDGPAQFQERVNQIHSVGPSQLLFLEWAFIFLPIIFHGLVGLLIVTRGMRNVTSYPYGGNIRYILQRSTGVIAFVFIFWHVFHMRGWLQFAWWESHISRPLGGANFVAANAPATAAAAIQASPVIFAVYAIGVLACVYHLSNGLWTMGITWGVWISPKAQRKANYPIAAFGMLLAAAGLGALIGLQTQPLPAPASGGTEQAARARDNPVRPIEPEPIAPDPLCGLTRESPGASGAGP